MHAFAFGTLHSFPAALHRGCHCTASLRLLDAAAVDLVAIFDVACCTLARPLRTRTKHDDEPETDPVMKSFYAFENGAAVRADTERDSIVVFVSPDDREKQELTKNLGLDATISNLRSIPTKSPGSSSRRT